MNGDRKGRTAPGDHFREFSHRAAEMMGSYKTFLAGLAITVVWLATGPLFHYSDTWQLIINTGTTIVTFLMVFLIQNTQNRDTKAMQLKLDELLRTVKTARNKLLNVEDLSDEELERLRSEFSRLAAAPDKPGKSREKLPK